MEIKHRNEWIDIGHLEENRTYVFPGGREVTFNQPDKLFIGEDDQHFLICKDGHRHEVIGSWIAFYSKGEWGIDVAKDDSEETPEIKNFEPDTMSIEFHYDNGDVYLVDNPILGILKDSGSLKVEDAKGFIHYIKPYWCSRKINALPIKPRKSTMFAIMPLMVTIMVAVMIGSMALGLGNTTESDQVNTPDITEADQVSPTEQGEDGFFSGARNAVNQSPIDQAPLSSDGFSTAPGVSSQ